MKMEDISWAAKDIFWFVIAGLLLFAVLSQFAEAEDCYNPTGYENRELYPEIKYRRAPNKRDRAIIKRAKTRKVNVIKYFIKDTPFVTSTFETLGYDKSAAVGRKANSEIALKLTQGWLGEGDDTYLTDHQDLVYEIKCEERNWCRKAYNRTPAIRTICFQELHVLPKHRELYQGIVIASFGEVRRDRVE
jgi:hypothetical protein